MRTVAVVLALFVVEGATAQRKSSGPYSLRLARQSWALVLPLSGFTIVEEVTRPDGSQSMVQAIHAKSRLVVSSYLEPQRHSVASRQCRDKYWPMILQSPLVKKNVRTYETGKQVRGEYFVDSVKGEALHQQNVYAFIGVSDVCAEVHVSMPGFTGPSDRTAMETLLNSVSVRK